MKRQPSLTQQTSRQAIRDRLLPGLLERLTDSDPHGERPAERVVSLARYREEVRRNLEWILTGSGHLLQEDISQFPEVRNSVLNMGVQQLYGQSDTGLKADHLRLRIIEAIKLFEPRVLTRNLDVKVETKLNVVVIQISGELWASPAPERFSVQTSIDIETGRSELAGMLNG
jgi:type VI secretion system protein ImpF